MIYVIEKIMNAPDYFKEIWNAKVFMLDMGTLGAIFGGYMAIIEEVNVFSDDFKPVGEGILFFIWTIVSLVFIVLRVQKIKLQIQEQRLNNEAKRIENTSKCIANEAILQLRKEGVLGEEAEKLQKQTEEKVLQIIKDENIKIDM